jgi:SAM-dependent methyltransferase
MSAVAAGRLPGRVVIGDARFLPVADGSVDAVTAVWLLHLVVDVGAIVAGVARVLRSGGSFVTTVDKAAAHYSTGDDVGALLEPLRRPVATDAAGAVTGLALGCGFVVAGRASFRGVGQGRSPAEWGRHLVEQGGYSGELLGAVAALPDQERRRGDPEFTVLGFTKA